ncbi:MAG: hypothetical protein RI936_34 [Pseudomonadota bacterium]|jgi:uncharacterized small protein (DUF1192 family)
MTRAATRDAAVRILASPRTCATDRRIAQSALGALRETPPLDPYATLRLPPGKPVGLHLRHLTEFWAADSAPHQLARATLDEMLSLEREIAALAAEVARLKGERASVDTADTLAAELADPLSKDTTP